MLRKAGIAAPYILVGHSFGGLVVRRFAAAYPADVSGVVLVDAMRPDEWPPLNPRQRAAVVRGIRLAAVGAVFARVGIARLVAAVVLHRSGIANMSAGRTRLRVIDRITTEVGKMPRAVWPVVAAHWSSPAYYRGIAAHLRAIPATVREMQNAVPIREIPVVLLTPGRAEALSAEALLRIGPTTRQVIAAKSSHWVHLDEPELVIEAIRGMVEHAKLQVSAAHLD
jgi:pimeloyl-ACP methyl ester carboxylesterase